MSDGKVIIGIHGLANKPPRRFLSDWWKQSIVEGLHKQGVANPTVNLAMVYWADLLYRHPQHHEDPLWSFDSLYNAEPYVPADPDELKELKDRWYHDVRAFAGDLFGSTVDKLKQTWGFGGVADLVLGNVLKDLAFYYDEKRIIRISRDKDADIGQARKVLIDLLKTEIQKQHAAGKQIMLIAHSMGCIIAYDALRELGDVKDQSKRVNVSHLVTIGSPLGLPHVVGKIIEHRMNKKKWDEDPMVRTPTVVTENWTNFADPKDPVAADIHLADDYEPNKSGSSQFGVGREMRTAPRPAKYKGIARFLCTEVRDAGRGGGYQLAAGYTKPSSHRSGADGRRGGIGGSGAAAEGAQMPQVRP